MHELIIDQLRYIKTTIKTTFKSLKPLSLREKNSEMLNLRMFKYFANTNTNKQEINNVITIQVRTNLVVTCKIKQIN